MLTKKKKYLISLIVFIHLKKMNISKIIGLTITEIRYTYSSQNEYDIQEFFAYLKLSNELIIEIPQYSDCEIYKNAERDQIFKNAKTPNKECRKRIENQKITDIHFCYFDNKQDFDFKAYIELENGIFFTEENRGQQGITNIDLEILNKLEFEERKNKLDHNFKIIGIGV